MRPNTELLGNLKETPLNSGCVDLHNPLRPVRLFDDFQVEEGSAISGVRHAKTRNEVTPFLRYV